MKDFSDMFILAADYYHKNFSCCMTGNYDDEVRYFFQKNNYTDDEILRSGLCIKKQSVYGTFILNKISFGTIKTLKIGFADNQEWGLYNCLKNKDFSDKEILDSGLCYLTKENLVKDILSHSITFPVFGPTGKILGLISKKIDKRFNQSPFLNIPNPSVDTSKENIFTFNYDGYKRGYVIICENPFDVVYNYNNYIFNSIGFFNQKIELNDDVLSFIRSSGSTVKLMLNSDREDVYRAETFKDVLKKQNIFVL
ncbi:MAG: hypothetical protein IJY79_08860 [Clostridia bacterium]|nr:hypothetical protein [Clostridia bacterium]